MPYWGYWVKYKEKKSLCCSVIKLQKLGSASAVNGHQGRWATLNHRKCTWKICVLQSGAEILTHACEYSLKCLDSKIEFINLITKDFCSNVNGPVSGEALFSG